MTGGCRLGAGFRQRRKRSEFKELVEHARVLALRDDTWKYIEPGPGPARDSNTKTEWGVAPGSQICRLDGDLGETNNLFEMQPDRARNLRDELEAARRPSSGTPE